MRRKRERNPVKLFDDIGVQLAQGLNIVNGARELRLPVDKQNADFFAHLPGSALVLPLNAVTSLVGAPVVVWVILRSPYGAKVS